MTRISKQARVRAMSPKRHKPNLSPKTGSKKDNLSLGFKPKENAIESLHSYIPKIK